MNLQSDPNLDTLGYKSLILYRKLQGYKSVDTPTKYQKDIPANLVLHLYRKQHSRLRMAIVKLISIDFFFGVIPCKYSTTLKGYDK